MYKFKPKFLNREIVKKNKRTAEIDRKTSISKPARTFALAAKGILNATKMTE